MDSVDCLIDLPVVKIIGVVGLTAAMKNLVGMVPNTETVGRMQVINHSYAHLDEAIVDLNLLYPVDFVVADAIVGLERAKTTTWDGQAVRLNTVLASVDVVAADAVAARLIGLNPDDIGYLELAQRLGVGVADLEEIQVRGDDLAQVSRRFEKMKSIYDRYGQTPHDWVLNGPYPARSADQDFLDPRGPAAVPGTAGWSEPLYLPTDQIDLRRYYGQPRDCVVYAYTEFTAPRAEPAELWVGSGEAMTVWIDGEEVYRFQGSRRHRVPNDQQPIRLLAGRHRLLVKAYQTIGAFDFSLNICEAHSDPRYNGNRVAGLRFVLPGDATAPVPRSGSPQAGERFDIRDWVTARIFVLTIEEVLDSKTGLPADGISRLAFDPSGRLWVGTDKGVYRRDSDTTWTVYGEAQGVRPGWVDALLVNPGDGHVWTIVRGKLHHFDGQSWRVHFPDNWHGNLFLDSRGRTCASVWMNGVRCYEQGRWISYRQHEEGNDFANWTETGQTDRDGNVWLGTWGHGVWRYDGSDWAQFTVRQGLADNHVNRLRAAPNGDLWAAYAAPGISRLHRGRWRSYYGDGAPPLETEALLIARSGTVWAATGGMFPTLSRFDGRHWATATIDGDVLDMVEDWEGRIWLATGNAVVAARLE